MSRRARTLRDTLRVWLGPPSWTPPGVPSSPPPQVTRDTRPKYDPPVPLGLRAYVSVWLVLVAIATTALLFQAGEMPREQVVAAAIAIFATVVAWGGLFERKRWAIPFEVARLATLAVGAAILSQRLVPGAPIVVAIVLTLGAMAIWVLRYRSGRAAASA